MIETPKFTGNAEERAGQIARWAHERLVPRRISIKSLSQLGMRTPEQVLATGHVIRNYSCIERSALMASLMSENGFTTHIIGERTHYDGKPNGMHFLVQGELDGERVTVDPMWDEPPEVTTGWRHDKGAVRTFQRGRAKITYETTHRVSVPRGSSSKKSLNICGFENRKEYLTASGIRLSSVPKMVQNFIGKQIQNRKGRGQKQ